MQINLNYFLIINKNKRILNINKIKLKSFNNFIIKLKIKLNNKI